MLHVVQESGERGQVMPGLGVEVEVRRGVSWRSLRGGSGSAGGRLTDVRLD